MIQNRIQGNLSLLSINKIQYCLDYVKQNDLKQVKPGSYEIDGSRIFMNVVEYDTRDITECYWEAHRKYIDIHVIISGSEQININHIDNLQSTEYVEKDDYLKLSGDASVQVILKENDYLICYPEDAHMTAIQPNEPSHVVKAIFKVQYND